MIFAQANLDQVPDSIFKWVLIVLIGLAILICAIVATFRKPERQRTTIEDQPVEVRKAPKRYNHEQSEGRYAELKSADAAINKRIDENESELNTLWEAVRGGDDENKNKIHSLEVSIAASLARIEERLNIKPKRS